MQTAYKQRVRELAESERERGALKEELDKARTRAEALRGQLEGMGASMADKDAVIADLVQKLTREGEQRRSRPTSIRVVGPEHRSSRSSVLSRPDSPLYAPSEEDDDEYSTNGESVFSHPHTRSRGVRPAGASISDYAYRRSTATSVTSFAGEESESEAWGVVGVLKEENRALKERVVYLESEVDGVLGMVRGLGIS
jgi:hypothetical protein